MEPGLVTRTPKGHPKCPVSSGRPYFKRVLGWINIRDTYNLQVAELIDAFLQLKFKLKNNLKEFWRGSVDKVYCSSREVITAPAAILIDFSFSIQVKKFALVYSFIFVD